MKTKRINPCDEIQNALQQDPSCVEEIPTTWEQHVHDCASCQLTVQAAKRMLLLLRQAGDNFELNIRPEQLVQEAIRRSNTYTKSIQVRWRFNWKNATAFALGVALLVVGGWWYTRNQITHKSVKISTIQQVAVFELRSVERIKNNKKREILPHDTLEIASGGDERILLTFSDGTRVQLNESTRVRLDKNTKRSFHVEEGEILVDVVRQQGLKPLQIHVPDGVVNVVGTRLLVRTLLGMSVVNVLRGHVITETDGRKADVRAGGEALLRKGKEPLVQAALSLDHAMEWAEREVPIETDSSGFGSLRARKPGSSQDTELQLAERLVDVKIQGRIARTEIEESFYNDSHDTLEGIYTFPLPPDAQIAALDLEVDGKWEHGAIVEKNRGNKIWAGVIRNATPQSQKKQIVEYVWVPGPWRDPALLNWKKGSEFEMRIFPIPAKGARRVRIAYTQVLTHVPGGVRYALPMPSKSQVIAQNFRITAQISNFKNAQRLRVFPYNVQRHENEHGVHLEYQAANFTPHGDWVVEIPETDPEREIRAWAYRPESGTGMGPQDFGLVALRPRLPVFEVTHPLEWIFVVDRSWGTQRTRLHMAARAIFALVENLETSHYVQVWACNHECTRIRNRVPGSKDEAQAIQKAIEELQPMGSTSMDAVISAAKQAIHTTGMDPKHTRIVYFGDGVVTTGETQADQIAEKISQKLAPARFSTVAMGGNVDNRNLVSWARAGKGAALMLKSGEAPETFAGKVLQRQLSVPLENVRIEFPVSVRDLAPENVEQIWPGEEVLLAFRGDKMEGELVLTGTFDGVAFSRHYTIKMEPQPGNLFVPRLWAQGRIRDLEGRAQTPEIIKEIVNISRSFHVLSRHTSLLVLESPAMAKAFGVEDTRPKLDFTGTEDVQESETSGPQEATGKYADDIGGGGGGNAHFELSGASRPMSAPKPTTPGMMPEPISVPPLIRERRRMIRMRKEWYRTASIREPHHTDDDLWTKLQQRKAEYEQKPNSRDRLKSLVEAALATRKLDEAQKWLDHWLQKDPMDAQALLAQADASFLRGEVAKAAAFIESAVDVEPSAVLHARLVGVYQATGRQELACSHALARALTDGQNLDALVQAARCTGNSDRFFATLKPSQVARAKKLLDTSSEHGDPVDQLTLEALWDGDGQIDIVVITPAGKVVSFAGGAKRVRASFVESKSMEKLAISMEKRGKYQIVVVPRAENKGRPIQGKIKIVSYESSRSFPFAVADKMQQVAEVNVSLAFRWVPE